ncbi:hypothetical protein MKEN_00364800 [Mycena kentingensis (nom. inval.)]|nr:hypothetical protein MKEN_00364800 [Mycena kentingensis (nom. inval.)]
MSISSYPLAIPCGVQFDATAIQWSEPDESTLDDFVLSTQVDINVPPPAQELLLFCHGSLSRGNVSVSTGQIETARVHVVVHYHESSVRKSVRVGLVRRGNQCGVGVFTPTNFEQTQSIWPRTSTRPKLHFEINLLLPEGTEKLPFMVNSLAVDIYNMSISAAQLDLVRFGKVTLKSINGPIEAQTLLAETAVLSTTNGWIDAHSLAAERAQISTCNGSINGELRVSKSAKLQTTNESITANINVYSDTKELKTIDILATNGAIKSTLNLESTSPDTGNFGVQAQTSNEAVSLRVESLRLGGQLVLDARTSNDRGYVWLPSTYEGTLSASTSNWSARLKQLQRPDPIGQGRARAVEYSQSHARRLEGRAYWTPVGSGYGRGSVSVSSSNGSVVIEV